MNIVIIKTTNSPVILPQDEPALNKSFRSLRAKLSDAGQVLLEDEINCRGCFLVSTPNLLIALRKADRAYPQISIQVFSLAPPREQLLGTVTEDNCADPASYDLPHAFPTA